MKKKHFATICFVILFCYASSSYGYNIQLTSIPKAGTNLVRKLIEMLIEQEPDDKAGRYFKLHKKLLRKDNNFFQTHLSYTKEIESILAKNNFKVVLVYRDPRDQIVSRAHYVYQNPTDPANVNFKTLSKWPINNVITYFINRVDLLYSRFLPWRHSKLCCSISFEKLIGPLGGGNLQDQIREIKKVAAHLGVPLSEEKTNYIVKNLFGDTPTFRKGQIGGWKKAFTRAHKMLMKKKGGHLVKLLNYEHNNNW